MGVGFDWDYPYSCSEWAQTFGISYPIIDDSSTAIIEQFGYYVPWNVILDHNFTVHYSAYGRNETAIVQTIQKLLGVLPPPADEPTESIPSQITLHNIYPNPFNSSTTIAYSLSSPADVAIDIIDLKGEWVYTVQNENHLGTGLHSVIWNASSEASGIYIVRLRSGNSVEMKKVLLVK